MRTVLQTPFQKRSNKSEPAEEGLCHEDEPIFVCWENLTPEQRRYETTLNCARDTAAAPQPALEPTRIEFAQGEMTAQVQGSLAADGAARHVLTAMAGQEMTLSLSVTRRSNRQTCT